MKKKNYTYYLSVANNVHFLCILALVDIETGEYLLNGNWIVTPFQKLIEYGGTLIEYTGSNTVQERINSTKPVKKKLLVQV